MTRFRRLLLEKGRNVAVPLRPGRRVEGDYWLTIQDLRSSHRGRLLLAEKVTTKETL